MGYWDTSYPPSLWAPKPPAPKPPTGATVGAPGVFTPTGSDVPASISALNLLGALGQTTAWPSNSYVVLGDASNAYWNGTIWTAGRSPVAEPPPEDGEAEQETDE